MWELRHIKAGSLEEVEAFNGHYLYGKSIWGEDVMIHQLGTEPLGFDPNDDPELEEAYGFITVETE